MGFSKQNYLISPSPEAPCPATGPAAQPALRAHDSRAAQRGIGTSMAFWWQAGGGNASGRCTRKSTFASRESSASAGSRVGSPAAPRALAGSSTPPPLQLLPADTERLDQAPSSFGGWGLMKNLGTGGLNLENNITLIVDLQWEGGKPA